MKDSFWAGGAEAHSKAIAEQHRQRMDTLQAKKQVCVNDQERELIDHEIQAATLEYETELKSIKWKLF